MSRAHHTLSHHTLSHHTLIRTLPLRGRLGLEEIYHRSGLKQACAASAAGDLIRSGYLQRSEGGDYSLTPCGREVLRTKLDLRIVEQSVPAPPQRRSFRLRLWRVMALKDSFRLPELVALAGGGTHESARRFVKALCQGGYLVKSRGIYRVVHHTGHLCPHYNSRTRRLSDPNTSEVFHV